MSDRFSAVLITKPEGSHQMVAETSLTRADLMPGDVLVRVDVTSVNYKDGLAITGKAPVVRRFPMIPGVDLAGTVVESAIPTWKPGDTLVVNGWGLGEVHYGGFAGYAAVKAEWPVALPAAFTTLEAMAIGTAGYTAMLAVIALERAGIAPGRGPVLVTGASGGVGSVAIAVLARLGFDVVAATGQRDEADYLKLLGAREILDRSELTGPPTPLARERWAAAIDTVGGAVLANVLAATAYHGVVAACGNSGGMDLPSSVAPFILRGVSLTGIDSVRQPIPARVEAWRRLARDLDRPRLAAMTTRIAFADVIPAAREIVEGRVRGRLVVDMAGTRAD